MAHTLPDLGFSKDALEPHISAETFDYHHGKHHNAYVTKLNAGIEGTEFADMSLKDIIKKASGGIFNNAAQHYNHSFYWKCITPGGASAPSGELATMIDKTWGSFDKFKQEFSDKAATLFGSGWCWLVKKSDGSLAIQQTINAECPVTDGHIPMLTCDVWEHAYYVDYRNARPNYVEAFWNVVNWDHVAKCYTG